MGRLCYISRRYKDCKSAGNKAKSDYEDILCVAGAVNLGLPRTYGGGKALTFLRNLAGVLRYERNVRPADTVVLQYPVKKYFTRLCRAAHRRDARVVALVHDLGCCRRRKLTVAQEIDRLDHADVVVATNAVMARWLVEHGLDEGKVKWLGLHDYLSPAQPCGVESMMQYKGVVAYAGSLSVRKNSFLSGLSTVKGVTFELYGGTDDVETLSAPNVHVNGYVEPDRFIENPRAGWGLVWDGDRMDTCSGAWGEYLALNTPHKSAFYLRAGLPLVVWSGSAIAPMVLERGLGIAVDGLSGLGECIRRISEQDYAAMCRRVRQAGMEAACGDNLRALLRSL